MAQWSAEYIDGVTGKRLPVTLTVQGPELAIHREDGRELDRWPGRSLRAMPGAAPNILGLAGDALAAIDVSDAVLEQIRAAFPADGQTPHRRPRDVPVIGWLVGAAASLAIVIFVLIPALAEPLARLVPDAVEDRIGREAVAIATAFLVGDGDPIACTEPAGTAALTKIVDRLQADLPVEGPSFKVEVIGSGLVNALAAPGGYIVIPLGMIRYAESPEALAGVVAHEMAHVIGNDGMVRMMRVGLFSVLLSLFTGDIGGGIASILMTQMLESGYSQDVEMRADRVGAELLMQAGVDHVPFIGFFERLEKAVGDRPDWLRWVASHPETVARIAALREMAPTRPSTPLLSDNEWAALKDICGAAGQKIETKGPGKKPQGETAEKTP